MDLKERILLYMRGTGYKPSSAEAVAEDLELSGEERQDFLRALEEMELEGSVVRNRSGLYGTPARMHLVVGRISMTAKGFGFIIPDVRESEEETDVFVPGAGIGSAMHGDRVLARVSQAQAEGRSREGEILRILERANEKIVGTFESSKTFGFVTPDNVKLTQDIFIPKKQIHGAKTGTKVVVSITKWPDGRRNAEGEVVEILGKAGAPGVDVLSVMRQYDLSEDFPAPVQKAANGVGTDPSPEEYSGRRDRRKLKIVTVDGEDSKDLDDGVYAEKKPEGGYFLGVYIADVSYYVRENEPLDLEARERGTSVYLVDRVIPMLPKELSNGICSLNEGVDRLSLACEMQLSPRGEVTSYEIVPTVIHVYRRLTYNIVNKVLEDREEPFLSDNADIRDMLETLAEIRNLRKELRHQRGSIDFELPEIKVKLDEKGHPVALVKREQALAESIIEECMLAANETVAKHMDTRRQPFIYRVHEQPTSEKIERLNNLLAAFGKYVRQDEAGHIRPMDVEQVLESVQGKPEERIISAVALRSMQQARYSELSLGHFGLAARYYTHFTSPIRRYPDLIVHRLLREEMAPEGITAERRARLKALLPEIAELSSQRERVAIEAERETTDMKKIEYMAQFVGEEFSGVISGVTAFGIFVELDNGVEGLVHVSTMANDFYEYREELFAMVGERTRQQYRLGDEVEVLLVRANVEERNLDFVLKDNGAYEPETMQKAAHGGRRGGSQAGREKHRQGRGQGLSGAELLADVGEDSASKGRSEHKKRSEGRKRGSSGEKVSRPVGERTPRLRSGRGRGRQEGTDKSGKAARAARETLGKGERKGRNREERREGDYHRVKITGLTSAVWPDPPGYHEDKERKEREKSRREERRPGAPKDKPHLKRKTEGGTGNSK